MEWAKRKRKRNRGEKRFPFETIVRDTRKNVFVSFGLVWFVLKCWIALFPSVQIAIVPSFMRGPQKERTSHIVHQTHTQNTMFNVNIKPKPKRHGVNAIVELKMS